MLLKNQEDKIIESIYITKIFKIIIIKLNNEFKVKFKKNYSEDNLWDKIFKIFIDISKKEENISININFKLRNGLIYHLNKEG